MGHVQFIANHITMTYKLHYLERDGEEEAFICDKAHAHLAVHYFVVGLNGEMITDTVVRSVHWFVDCSQSSLKAAIKQNEPFPMEFIMRPEDAERMRVGMSAAVHSLVRYIIGARAMERPRLEVTAAIYQTEVEERVHRTLVADYKPDEADGVIRGDLRMCMTMKSVYSGKRAARGGGGENVCVICLEKMTVGEEIVRTPCNHHFHGECLRRWFEKTGSCPLCRLDVDQ